MKGPVRSIDSTLIWVRPVKTLKNRLGGSVFAQVYSSLGKEVPDFTEDDVPLFKEAFDAIQTLTKGTPPSLVNS